MKALTIHIFANTVLIANHRAYSLSCSPHVHLEGHSDANQERPAAELEMLFSYLTSDGIEVQTSTSSGAFNEQDARQAIKKSIKLFH